MTKLGKAQFGVSTFFAASHPNDKCGANGLPLTPNSIKILGRFQHLTTLQHSSICKYLDIVRGKHERIIVVSEYYTKNLAQELKTGTFSDENKLLMLAFDILQGLAYLNSKGLTHRNLEPENILFDPESLYNQVNSVLDRSIKVHTDIQDDPKLKEKVKLSEYGMYYMTDYGADVAFPIGLFHYMAPEVICSGPSQVDENTYQLSQPSSSPKVDIWSLGCILLEIFSGEKLWSGLSMQQIMHQIVNFVRFDINPFDTIVTNLNCEAKLKNLSKVILDFLRQCLTVSPTERPSPEALLQHQAFIQHRLLTIPHKNGYQQFTSELRCRDLELPSMIDDSSGQNTGPDDHLSERSMEEVYYLWRLAGGDLDAALRKAELIKTKPPITLVPRFTLDDGEVFGQVRDSAELLNNTVIVLSQEQLRNRLADIDETAYYPLLEDENIENEGLPTSPSSVDLSETASLPLVIKEKDVEYQFHRVILYERLLKAYPYKRAYIWKEARVDIPPLYRNLVWAALLEVEGDIQALYDSIDKETPIGTDRQIEVDIPRCHQYHELLSSPTAHAKFKRILKAWVMSHSEYVYWQGLDSLCAPFLALNFNNEALAYACLRAFIPKYLHKFFLRDNSPVIQEYLAVFSHLIAFHDPELSNHLNDIGFIPDLYSIPWFLTMYAHVFPLHKIVHLWDTLLLGNSSFPLFIGVSILRQLKDRLLSYGFNECILLFSDMPEINIQKCVQESIHIFCNTPKSATYRQHARPPRTQRKSENLPTISYYTRDYNEQPQNELSMEPIPIEELKMEKCCRISAEDLIELGELVGQANTRSPTKKRANSKPMIIVIDIRGLDEYKRGTIPGSINIPFSSAFTPEGQLVPCPAVQTLNSHKTQVKVVVGSRGRNAMNFASELVRLGYAKVCVLHKGIDVLRQTGILTVPPADI